MILESLFKRYESLADEDKLPLYGWSNEKIAFGLKLNEDGEILEIVDLRTEVTRGKKKLLESPILKVPQRVERTSGVKPNFLYDNSSYILGINHKNNSSDSVIRFQAAEEMHLKILQDCNSKPAIAVKNFFKNWNPIIQKGSEILKDNMDKIKENNLIFMFDDKFISEAEDVKNAWLKYFDNSQNNKAQKKQCLITGNTENIAITHPPIKGVLGALSSGAKIIAFNKGNLAFESYGNRDSQGLNAPVSKYAAFAYTTVLNNMLRDKKHIQYFGDTTLLYWAEKDSENYQKAFEFFTFGAGDKTTLNEQAINNAMDAINAGKSLEYNNTKLELNTPFYLLGLSPNMSRISIRFFIESDFGEILKNIVKHHKNMEIISVKNDVAYVPFWKIEDVLVSSKAQDRNLSPILAGSILKSIFCGDVYPKTLYMSAMSRTWREQDSKKDDNGAPNYKISQGRCAIIKAYLSRNKGKEITMALNEDEKNTAYILGRIFAVLEKIQKRSNPDITIKDKYFTTYCSMPRKIFPILNKLSQYHLKRLKGGLKIYYDKMLRELMGKLETDSIPKILPLEEQGMLVLGYYHQNQKLYTKKEDNENE